LGAKAPVGDSDTTGTGNAVVIQRAAEAVVTGEFRLSTAEQGELGFSETIRLRRTVAASETPVYEVLQEVPKDDELSGIDDMKIQELRAPAASREVEADGLATMSPSSSSSVLEGRVSSASPKAAWQSVRVPTTAPSKCDSIAQSLPALLALQSAGR
jgi:hypothetical protein